MSVEQMAEVWRLDLPANKKFVLLAYADHADEDGNNVFPSLGRIAHKTGYSRDQVRRISKELREADLMELVEENTPTRAAEYRLTLERGSKLPPLEPRRGSRSPLGEGGKRPLGERGEMPPKPSENHQEPPDSTEGAASGNGEEGEEEADYLNRYHMKRIYDHLKENGIRLDGNEFGHNLGRTENMLRNDGPTERELEDLPQACLEYFRWHGKLDVAKALRRLRQQGLREEGEAKQAASPSSARQRAEDLKTLGGGGARMHESSDKPKPVVWYASLFPVEEETIQGWVDEGLGDAAIMERCEAAEKEAS